jgi:hypothetical protein
LTLNPALATPTNAGTYAGGTIVTINASGTVNLNAPSSLIIMNPDGSLNNPQPASCTSCWQPGYQYYLEGSAYPTTFGGDGINHFVGGGGNFDAFGGVQFAGQGKPTTDTLDPAAIRFGAIAGTFATNPTALDWFLVGYGGSWVVPAGGATLQLVVVDTFYSNNAGAFNLTVDNTVPEPSVAWLALSGLAFLGFRRYRARVR